MKKAKLQKCLSTVVLPKTSAGFGLVVGSDGSIGPGCSGAAAAGHAKMILTTGSKITAVNDVSVSSLDDIVTEMDKAQEGDDVSFTIEVVMSGGTRAAAPDSTELASENCSVPRRVHDGTNHAWLVVSPAGGIPILEL